MAAEANWRARMAVRGGPVSHLIARAGWLVFGALGALVMVAVAAIYAANPGDPDTAENGVAANFIGGLIVMMPIGAVLAAILGLLSQFAVRAWLATPTAAERRTARVDTGLRPSGPWSRSYETCAASVTAFHAMVEALPKGAGREWFATIGATLDDELAEALRLARLGESLPKRSAAARRAADLLHAAETSFADTTERAAAIALDLRSDSDFVQVRAQLDMLADQAPHLRAEGIT